MKRMLSIFLLLLLIPSKLFALAAFPGAEGAGGEATGARGYAGATNVCRVDTLSDNTADGVTFRDCIEGTGNEGTYVVFRVSGNINLATKIDMESDYITIAGETSPNGVAITGASVDVEGSHYIIRYMRFRPGSHVQPDENEALHLNKGAENVIIDHSSLSWAGDEVFQIGIFSGAEVDLITIQWSMIYEGLLDPHQDPNHAYPFFITDKKGDNGSPASTMRVSVHHNLIAHGYGRVPEIKGDWRVDYRNNITYNWYHSSSFRIKPGSDSAIFPELNIVSNYFKSGPENVGWDDCSPAGNNNGVQVTPNEPTKETNFYATQNIGCGPDGYDPSDWFLWNNFSDVLLSTDYQSGSAWSMPGIAVTTTTMTTAYATTILETAGASKPVRDSADLRIVTEFAAGTGSLKNDVTYPDDFPDLATGAPSPPTDSDSDGMDDAWETINGLNVGVDDHDSNDLGGGYDNIEHYFHYLARIPAINISSRFNIIFDE